MALAQGGEFAFVLFQFSKTNGILPNETVDPLISAVAISMFLAPLMFLAYDRIAGQATDGQGQERPSDEIDANGRKVILAGFGRMGTDLGRFLISAGIRPVILDHDPANVDVLRKFGFEVYYGDVTRMDLLETAGAEEAEALVVAIRDLERVQKLVASTQKHFPKLKIASVAADRSSAYSLMDLGVRTIRLETFGSALDLGQDTLELLGFEPYEAHRLKAIFRKQDEKMLPELYALHRSDEASYISMYQKHNDEIEELMNLDRKSDTAAVDQAWSANSPEK